MTVSGAGSVARVEDPDRFLCRNRQARTNNRKAVCNKNRAQEPAISPTNFEPRQEDTFHAAADGEVSNEQPVSFKNGLFAPPKSEGILVCDATTRIPFHVEKAMTKLVIETFTD